MRQEPLVSDSKLADLFEAEFAKPASGIEQQAAIHALGDEYPAGLDTYSWVSRTELGRVAALVPAAGAQVVDVGCGRGGPGLWVAGATDARLTGLDIAESALSRARELATRLGVDADFRLGSFEETGLPGSSVDLVMSFDAFLFTSDKAAAFVELARVLRPGGRLAITSWDYHTQPANRPPQVADHRPLVEAAGLAVTEYEPTEDWHERCVSFADYLIQHAAELAAEADEPVDDVRAGLREMRASIDCMSRRFLLVAERPLRGSAV
jgi:SAM-dependent methyltransferase